MQHCLLVWCGMSHDRWMVGGPKLVVSIFIGVSVLVFLLLEAELFLRTKIRVRFSELCLLVSLTVLIGISHRKNRPQVLGLANVALKLLI